MQLSLSAPTKLTFFVSIALAVVAVLIHFGNIRLPIFPTQGFLMLLAGYLVLLAGNLLTGA
jgi:hypothetical protein